MAVKAFLDDMPGTQTEEMLCDSFKKHPFSIKVRCGSQSQKTQRERETEPRVVLLEPINLRGRSPKKHP